MSELMYKFGEVFEDNDHSRFTTDYAKKLFSACQAHKNFEILALGTINIHQKGQADLITVECVNDQVPSKNDVGINVRERLAFCFFHDQKFGPEVRALRKTFPENLIHSNVVPPDEPQSLCVYYESWNVVERTWTPQRFLKRVMWWLSSSANGTLHPDDQPVERVYFDAPFELVLPPDFDQKIKSEKFKLLLHAIQLTEDGDFKLLKGVFEDATKVEQTGKQIIPFYLDLGSVVHDTTLILPGTLGLLDDQLKQKGKELIPNLQEIIKNKAEEEIITKSTGTVLLILKLSLQRFEAGSVESVRFLAFWITKELSTLGVELGALCKAKEEDRFLVEYFPQTDKLTFHDTEIVPVDVTFPVALEKARISSGINAEYVDFKGVIGGVGALGGTLIEIWAKEGWGNWTLVDDDILRSHNTIRHVGKEEYVGHYKSVIVAHLASKNFQPGIHRFTPLVNRLDTSTEEVKSAIADANLIIDATTTLDVPRDLANLETIPRIVSVFLTPSGRDSVLLLEDSDKTTKIDCLEAQYYRSILNSEWGEKHLQGHLGNIVVGAGCRDVSTVMSFEQVSLHSACLAKQVRLLTTIDSSAIRIWCSCKVTGAVDCKKVAVEPCIEINECGWRVVYDRAIHAKLKEERQKAIPLETGGVVLGYIDQKLKTIFMVDVLEAPPDSESSETHFVRGVEGLNERIGDAESRTAKIVGYIGEWHSHPAFVPPLPSRYDKRLANYLADTLADDGLPVLMIIIGSSGDVNITVKQH